MSWQPSASLDCIRERARVYRQIRSFFNTRGYLEVDTPLLMRNTNTDVNITSLQLGDDHQRRYLQTSPEFAMKRLLAAGSGSIFQICHAFRGAEIGRLHSAEFTLLEWYRSDYDYQQLMSEIELLITTLSLRQCHFERISYAALFQQELALDIRSSSLAQLRQLCAARVSSCDSRLLDRDQCLDLLLSLVIAPTMQGYQFVYDYPISQASLARASTRDDTVAERFELFFDGIELANGFSELTDPVQQRQRFRTDLEKRQQAGLPQYEIDERFLAALESGLEDCAGVALGLDRLLMVLLELESIDEALVFTD